MVALDAAQERNLRAALSITTNEAEQLRIAFAAWTESRGYNYANSGLNTSHSPGVTPVIAAKLRESLSIPHDVVGSNGRSTGILQQTSTEVGGAWGDMAGTMDPAESARRFLAVLHVTGISQYSGTLLTSTGSKKVTVQLSDPIAADVLRVQQPLADEAESSNYNASQVAIAREIVAQLAVPTQEDWFMANNWDEAKAEVDKEFADLKAYIVDGNVMNAQANAIFSANTGAGSFAAQIAEQTALLQRIAQKLGA